MFSNSTQYAIRTILHMSGKERGEKSTVLEISKALNIPRAYLSKILQQLSRAGIIESSKGRGGGFYLTRQNLKRPLIDVVICIEGQNIFNKCILGLTICSDKHPCRLHDHYTELKQDLERVMVEESIKNLSKKSILKTVIAPKK